MTETSPPENLVMPLHAEEMVVAKRQVARTVRVTRETRSRDTLVEEALTQTGVVIERVPMGQFIEAMPPVREEGDLTILPVVEEVVVTTRRLRLVEEVRIRRVQTTSNYVETVKLREQHVVVTRSEPVILGNDATPVAVLAQEPTTILTTRSTTMSNETIVAVYDTVAHAEQAVNDLLAANVPQSAISRHAAEGVYSPASTSVTTRRPEDEAGSGFWSSLFGGSSDDHAVYDATLQSGGNVVSVATVPEHDYDAVMAILEKHNPVDIDERAATYGSTTATASTAVPLEVMAPGSMMATGMAGSDLVGSDIRASAPLAATSASTATTAEQGGVIQLAEESLAVGKRLINRGGTRVRRYVVETPVEESVTLHEEKVTLERHPVTDGRPVTDADFTDRTIELTETAEEAVMSKTARVVEEVSLGKTATDRTETIRDTVRKEEVEIEQIPGTTTTSSTILDPRAPKI
jgi:uncharacterized protein (TIGR02271 family)